MESWVRIYSIVVGSDARINSLILLPHGVLTTHRTIFRPAMNLLRKPWPGSIAIWDR